MDRQPLHRDLGDNTQPGKEVRSEIGFIDRSVAEYIKPKRKGPQSGSPPSSPHSQFVGRRLPGKSDVRSDLCPSDEVLAAFILGDLAEEVLDSIREHQEQCARCEFRACQLDDQIDPVIDTIRRTISRQGGTDRLSGPDGSADESVPREDRARSGGASIVQRRPGPWARSRLALGPATCRVETSGPMAIEAASINRPILPDYEIGESLLGRGSMGVVYKARHLKLNRVVALKMIAGSSSQASELFQIEAKAVARLQHPNIVQIFDIGNNDGQPFLVLEFVEGALSINESRAARSRPGLRPRWFARWLWRPTTPIARASCIATSSHRTS